MLRLLRQLLLCIAPALGIYAIAATQVFGQAALLPNAKQTFVDGTGKPLAGGKVYFYVPGSTNKKTTWSDNTQTSNNTNPVVLDAAGRAVIFGQGAYRQVVQNSSGVQQWDSYTNAYGSSSPSGATGTDTAPVGSIMSFSGFTIPINWQLAYGQTLSRADYSDLLAAITISHTSISCTASSATLTGFPDTSNFRIGSPIEATCIPTGTTIASIVSSSSITVSSSAVSTATVTATIFPWGNGDGVTTFNVPDLRGRVIAGPDAMGGSTASRLSTVTTISTTSGSPSATVVSATGISLGMEVVSANVPIGTTVSGLSGTTVTMSANATATASGTSATFYSFSSAGAPSASGGTKNVGIVQNNLPNVNFTVSGITLTNGAPTISGLTTAIGGIAGNVSFQGTNAGATGGMSSPGTIVSTNVTVATQGSAASGGNETPLSILQPTLTVNYIIKVKSNTTGAGGVVSIGGLFGDIALESSLTASTVSNVNYIGCTAASLTQIGCVQPDGITTVITGGKLVAIAGIASSIGIAATSITGGATERVLYDNGGLLGEWPVTGTAGSVVLSNSPTISGHPTIEGVTSTGASGTGNLLFSISPSITNPSMTTPTLGDASATTINGLTITPTVGGALTVASGKTLSDTSAIGSSILLGSTGGGFSAYAGTTCTNKFARGLNTSGAATCDTVANTDLANSSITFGATNVALGATLSAATARGPNGFNNESLHSTGDANVTISSTTRTEATTTSLTASRAWTLPAAASVNAGQSLILSDAAGAINGTNTIVATRSGSDTINGATTFTLNAQYQQATFISDGVSKWTVNTSSGGGGAVTSVFGRTGAVVAASGDYSFSQVSGTAATSQGGIGRNASGDAANTVSVADGAGNTVATTIFTLLNNVCSLSLTRPACVTFMGYADIRWWGAVCATDSTTAIQAAINYMNTTYAGGMVRIPLCSYYTTAQITVPGATTLVGDGVGVSGLGTFTDHSMLLLTGANSGFRDLLVSGLQNASATTAVVSVDTNVPVIIENSWIYGGCWAISTNGVDGHYNNIHTNAFGSTCGQVVSSGANWYDRVKLDGGPQTTTVAFQQNNYAIVGPVAENHFSNSDFTGNYSIGSVYIAASDSTSAFTAVNSVLANGIQISTSFMTQISNSTLGGAPAVLLDNSTGSLIIGNTKVVGTLSVTGSNTNRFCVNNPGLTC